MEEMVVLDSRETLDEQDSPEVHKVELKVNPV